MKDRSCTITREDYNMFDSGSVGADFPILAFCH